MRTADVVIDEKYEERGWNIGVEPINKDNGRHY